MADDLETFLIDWSGIENPMERPLKTFDQANRCKCYHNGLSRTLFLIFLEFAANKPNEHVRGAVQQVKRPHCVEVRSIIITASFTSTNGARNAGMRLKSAREPHLEVTVRKWVQSEWLTADPSCVGNLAVF